MSAPQTIPFRAFVGRLTWMLLAPMFLVIAAWAVATKSKELFSVADLAYFLLLGAALTGRWIEFRCGDARTATGEPATLQHVQRYTVVTTSVGLAVWGAATAVRMFWITT